MPPYEIVNLSNGRLYIVQNVPNLHDGFRDGLIRLMDEQNPYSVGSALGYRPDIRIPIRASVGLIRHVSIGEDEIVIKRMRNTRAALVDTLRDKSQRQRQGKVPYNRVWYERERNLSSYFRQLMTIYKASGQYRERNKNNHVLGPELLVEECLGLFVGDNSEQWGIFRYYHPINREQLSSEEDIAKYDRAVHTVLSQISSLEGFEVTDAYPDQNIIVTNIDEDFVGRWIDTEMLVDLSAVPS